MGWARNYNCGACLWQDQAVEVLKMGGLELSGVAVVTTKIHAARQGDQAKERSEELEEFLTANGRQSTRILRTEVFDS